MTIAIKIKFKLLLVVYKCVRKLTPAYLCELVQPKHKTKYGLRGDLLDLLHIPRSQNVTYVDRAFSVCGPTERNRIPLDIRHSESVAIFKTRLKTLLFTEHFGWMSVWMYAWMREYLCVYLKTDFFLANGLCQLTFTSMNNFIYFFIIYKFIDYILCSSNHIMTLYWLCFYIVKSTELLWDFRTINKVILLLR